MMLAKEARARQTDRQTDRLRQTDRQTDRPDTCMVFP